MLQVRGTCWPSDFEDGLPDRWADWLSCSTENNRCPAARCYKDGASFEECAQRCDDKDIFPFESHVFTRFLLDKDVETSLFWFWWMKIYINPVNHPPGGKWGSQVGEAIGPCVFFWARTAGSKLHVLWLTVVLKLLFPGDDGGRCGAGHLAGVKDQDGRIVLDIVKAQARHQKNWELVPVVICSSYKLRDCCVLPVLPGWVHRVRVVAVFCSAVHVALPIRTIIIASTFRVRPRTHDDRRS